MPPAFKFPETPAPPITTRAPVDTLPLAVALFATKLEPKIATAGTYPPVKLCAEVATGLPLTVGVVVKLTAPRTALVIDRLANTPYALFA